MIEAKMASYTKWKAPIDYIHVHVPENITYLNCAWLQLSNSLLVVYYYSCLHWVSLDVNSDFLIYAVFLWWKYVQNYITDACFFKGLCDTSN